MPFNREYRGILIDVGLAVSQPVQASDPAVYEFIHGREVIVDDIYLVSSEKGRSRAGFGPFDCQQTEYF